MCARARPNIPHGTRAWTIHDWVARVAIVFNPWLWCSVVIVRCVQWSLEMYALLYASAMQHPGPLRLDCTRCTRWLALPLAVARYRTMRPMTLRTR